MTRNPHPRISRLLGWRHVPVALVAMFLTAKTLAAVAAIIQPFLRIHYDLWFELGMVTGQVVVQWAVLFQRTWRERIDYAFVLVLVSFIGAVLLWPLLGWNHGHPVAPLVGVLYFFGVVGAIFAIHVTLVLRLKLPKIVCVTWVLYRLAILAFVVKL